jgi:hypothetical protein
LTRGGSLILSITPPAPVARFASRLECPLDVGRLGNRVTR